MIPDRRTLRDELRSQRRSLDAAVLARGAREVARRLLDLPELAGPGRLATYLPADGELDANLAAAELRARGWMLHLPVVGGGAAMSFVEWDDDSEMVENRFGIAEPRTDATHRERDALEFDVVIVPCVGADLSGNRLGMGAGFYDRALAPVRDEQDRRSGSPLLVVIAHDHAVLDALHAEEWDVPMDVVVTEERIVRRDAQRR